jgi:ABC-type branched-subunit amino acid transport system permease subunit
VLGGSFVAWLAVGARVRSLSTEALVVAMLGGQGTVTGVALGAYLYEELRGLKGEMEAIEQASIRKNCGIQFQKAQS